MKIFFGLLLILFLAFSGYHLTFRRFRLPLFARRFYLTGIEFLFLGILLGPQFLNIVDEDTRRGLEPLTALLLGWTGLLFGFQFEMARLRRFAFEFLSAAIMEGAIAFVWNFLGIYCALSLFFSLTGLMKIMLATTLASVAACTAQTGLALLPRDSVTRHRDTLKLLTCISNINGLIPLLTFGVAFLFSPRFLITTNIGRDIMGGFGLVLLYTLFLTRHRKESELILIVIGMAVLTSGTASVLHFSPLFANFFVGCCIVNLSNEKDRIFNILISVEKPVYLLILVFLGVNCHFSIDLASALMLGSVCFCLWRSLGKIFGGFAISHLSRELKRYPHRLGFGLLDMGGLSLAILLDFHHGFLYEMTSHIIGMILMAVVFNNLTSYYFLRQLLNSSLKQQSTMP
ncbi:hypothetical protein QUF72_22275 [Desulfobacterales bacterium HSG2]|nr:hypothetical protein [Desulfobacterales bacterium HSG2]